MSAFTPGWYLLYTMPRREKKVANRLAETDIHFYLATLLSTREINGRKRKVELPLFPSYLFVYLNNVKEYFESLGVDGVLRFVRFGKQIAMVNEDVIENVRILAEKGNSLEVSGDYFEPSQVVVIQDGPLSGLTCEVVRHMDKEKILVRVKILNRCILMSMQAYNLQPAITSCVSL